MTFYKKMGLLGKVVVGFFAFLGLVAGGLLYLDATTADEWEQIVAAQGGVVVVPVDRTDPDYDINVQRKLDSIKTDQGILQFMHEMTHQKVEADEKWGFRPMNDTTILMLIERLEKGEFSYKHELIEIATRWSIGDFSVVDEDHNYIWQLQGGTVGKATGILSPAEEQQYVSENINNMKSK